MFIPLCFSCAMNPYISAFQYLAQLRQCLSFETGDTCATLFSFRDRHIMNPKLRMDTPEAKVTQFKPPLASPYDEMIISHLKAIYFIHRENFAECWAKLVYISLVHSFSISTSQHICFTFCSLFEQPLACFFYFYK